MANFKWAKSDKLNQSGMEPWKKEEGWKFFEKKGNKPRIKENQKISGKKN
jgi:hypothetical protein